MIQALFTYTYHIMINFLSVYLPNYITTYFSFNSAVGKGSHYSGKCDDINIELKVNDLARFIISDIDKNMIKL